MFEENKSISLLELIDHENVKEIHINLEEPSRIFGETKDEKIELAITTLNKIVKNDRYLTVLELIKSLNCDERFRGSMERHMAD